PPGQPQVTVTIQSTNGGNVPVNGDNDNGSAINADLKHPRVPARRDFDVAPLPFNDPELIAGSVTGLNLPPGGTWTVTVTSTDAGSAKLWKDQKKTAAFTSADAPGGFFVEGTHESPERADITITATYTVPGTPPFTGSAIITVTPVIISFA